jgi:hypothetical protein
VTHLKTPPGLLEGGLALGLVGALLAFRLRRKTLPGGRTPLVFQLREGRFRSYGLAGLSAGIALCLLAMVLGRSVPVQGVWLTNFKMRNLESYAPLLASPVSSNGWLTVKPGLHDLDHFLEHFSDQADLAGARRDKDTQDAWARQMKVQLESQSNGWRLTFVSAGEDGRFGTEDDVRSSNVFVEQFR